MIIEYFKDYLTMSAYMADIILSEINNNSESKNFFNLGLPTGNTPVGMYNFLTEKTINWSNVRTFNLDEYMIDSKDERSFHHYMDKNLFTKINIPSENVFFPNLKDDYDQIIDNLGGLDLTVIGIGINGHIAFNEPGSSLQSKTRKISLTECTKAANSRAFGSKDNVPQEAITMGIDTILKSKKIILLAQGLMKLLVLKRAIWNNPTELLPASLLQHHKNVRILYCD